jgi:hypothetical protein
LFLLIISVLAFTVGFFFHIDSFRVLTSSTLLFIVKLVFPSSILVDKTSAHSFIFCIFVAVFSESLLHHFVVINLSSSFFSIQDSFFRALAVYVLVFVLNKYLPAIAHTIKLPILASILSHLKGHTCVPIHHHIVHLANTLNISLAVSALSFLDIASARVLAVDVSLFNNLIFGNPSFLA